MIHLFLLIGNIFLKITLNYFMVLEMFEYSISLKIIIKLKKFPLNKFCNSPEQISLKRTAPCHVSIPFAQRAHPEKKLKFINQEKQGDDAGKKMRVKQKINQTQKCNKRSVKWKAVHKHLERDRA